MIKLKKILVTAAFVGAGTVGLTGFANAEGQNDPAVNQIAQKKTIVDVAVDVNTSTGAFSYLLAAVGCLSESDRQAVIGALSGPDLLTLFAPTDAAFKELQTALGIDPPAPEKTCALGPSTVANVLTYHVTPGRRSIGSLGSVFNAYASKDVPMLNGASMTTNPDLTITDIAGQSVGVVPGFVNINASNGVIHVIDTVLLPFKP